MHDGIDHRPAPDLPPPACPRGPVPAALRFTKGLSTRPGLALVALTLAAFSVGASEYVLTGQLDLVTRNLGASESKI